MSSNILEQINIAKINNKILNILNWDGLCCNNKPMWINSTRMDIFFIGLFGVIIKELECKGKIYDGDGDNGYLLCLAPVSQKFKENLNDIKDTDLITLTNSDFSGNKFMEEMF